MYAAVYHAGPRWSDTASHNANLERGPNVMFKVGHSNFELGILDAVAVDGVTVHTTLLDKRLSAFNYEDADAVLSLAALEQLIDRDDPSLDEIDKAIDGAVSIVEPPSALSAQLTRSLSIE